MTENSKESGLGPEILQEKLPIANVREKSGGVFANLAASYMWLLALICLGMSIGLVWWSIPRRGFQIMIHFPDGHGLTENDSVLFRGIEVGRVDKVALNRSLTGVDVTVDLQPFAEPLAREGSRFWVVRPELSLGQVSGLETAVGSKYIGVLPGSFNGPIRTHFDGMASSPPDQGDGDGTEIILRGDDRYGVTPGSPLSYRGLIVGRVLSVELSRDARTVETRIRVFEPYTKLVTSETRFWASSGVNVDLGWGSGLNVEIESLETIIKGGVSMLTVLPGGKPIQPGQIFELSANSEPEWFEQASEIVATETENLRSALKLKAFWKQPGILYGTVNKQTLFVGTFINYKGEGLIAVPTDMIVPPEKAIANKFFVSVVGVVETIPIPELDQQQPMTLLQTDASLLEGAVPFQVGEIRVPQQPENCLAVRMEGELDEPTFLHIQISEDVIDLDWLVSGFVGDREVWHGAPILAEQDSRLIGFLEVKEGGAKIIPVWPELVQ